MTCPLCNSTSRPAGTGFRVVRCACGLRRTEPQPSDLAAHYPDDYYAFHEEGGGGLRGRIKDDLARRYRGGRAGVLSGLYRSMLRSLPPARPAASLLDVGCGAGDVLVILRDAGWRVAGVEPSARACDRGRALGLDIRCASAEEIDFDAAFDWVRLSHCLEHVRDPRLVLDRVRAALVPGGRALIALPDCGGLQPAWLGARWPDWDLPRHLFHFTVGTLSRLLRRSGLEPVRVRRYFNPARFLSAVTRHTFPVGLPRLGGPWVGALGLQDELVVWARRV